MATQLREFDRPVGNNAVTVLRDNLVQVPCLLRRGVILKQLLFTPLRLAFSILLSVDPIGQTPCYYGLPIYGDKLDIIDEFLAKILNSC